MSRERRAGTMSSFAGSRGVRSLVNTWSTHGSDFTRLCYIEISRIASGGAYDDVAVRDGGR